MKQSITLCCLHHFFLFVFREKNKRLCLVAKSKTKKMVTTTTTTTTNLHNNNNSNKMSTTTIVGTNNMFVKRFNLLLVLLLLHVSMNHHRIVVQINAFSFHQSISKNSIPTTTSTFKTTKIIRNHELVLFSEPPRLPSFLSELPSIGNPFNNLFNKPVASSTTSSSSTSASSVDNTYYVPSMGGSDVFDFSTPTGLVQQTKRFLSTDLGILDPTYLDDIQFTYIDPNTMTTSTTGSLSKTEYITAGRFFNLRSTFPDLEYRAHDFRVLSSSSSSNNNNANINDDGSAVLDTVRFTCRVQGTMRGELRLRSGIVPPSGLIMKCPPEAVSITFDIDRGKVIKICSGFVLDRYVGNTLGTTGVIAASIIAGQPGVNDWDLYPPTTIVSKLFTRPMKPLQDVDNFLPPFPEQVMIQLAKGILSSTMGYDEPTLLSEKEFIFITPTLEPIGKKEFIQKYAREEFQNVLDPQCTAFRVDPYDPKRVWVDIQPMNPIDNYYGPPQAMSFSFNNLGACVRITSWAVMDPSIGNTGGLGGPEGYKYSIGKPSIGIQSRSLSTLFTRLKKRILSPITGVQVDEYNKSPNKSSTLLPTTGSTSKSSKSSKSASQPPSTTTTTLKPKPPPVPKVTTTATTNVFAPPKESKPQPKKEEMNEQRPISEEVLQRLESIREFSASIRIRPPSIPSIPIRPVIVAANSDTSESQKKKNDQERIVAATKKQKEIRAQAEKKMEEMKKMKRMEETKRLEQQRAASQKQQQQQQAATAAAAAAKKAAEAKKVAEEQKKAQQQAAATAAAAAAAASAKKSAENKRLADEQKKSQQQQAVAEAKRINDQKIAQQQAAAKAAASAAAAAEVQQQQRKKKEAEEKQKAAIAAAAEAQQRKKKEAEEKQKATAAAVAEAQQRKKKEAEEKQKAAAAAVAAAAAARKKVEMDKKAKERIAAMKAKVATGSSVASDLEQKKREQAALNRLAGAASRATIGLFGLGGRKADDDDDDDAIVTKTTSSSATKKSAAPSGVPSITRWRRNNDNSITGLVKGSRGFTDGQRVTTSPIQTGTIAPGEVVKTGSGSRYYLE